MALEPVKFRGLDHVGLSVPDIDAAGRFLEDGLGAQLIYQLHGPSDPPFAGPQFEAALNVPPGTRLTAIRMYKLGTGPGVELFQYQADGQRPAARASDYGWQHIAVYADDLDAALERLVAAGGRALSEPWLLPGMEGGGGNRVCFVQTPFGVLVELICYPSPQGYEATTPLRRWKPPA